MDDLDGLYAWLQGNDTEFREAVQRHIGAHSMGAYVTVEWLLTRRGRFGNVVLVSPVGVPEGPQQVGVRGMGRVVRGLVGYLWRRGFTPQSVLRRLPVGMARGAVQRYVEARFTEGIAEVEKELMVEYFLRVSKAKGEGEKALGGLLKPGVWAKVPLEGRIEALEGTVSFVYGERDWMDWRVGKRIVERMGERAWLDRVSGADHNVFVDNPKEFAGIFVKACRRSEERL